MNYMNSNDYSPEQRKDIEERVSEAKKMLEGLNLQLGVIMQQVNIGNDVFGVKPITYLQDVKYQNVVSPIQNP